MTEESEIIRDFKKTYELVRSVPVLPWRIYAHHSVPRSKTYRQWRSDGRLILWVNRGAIHDLPVRKKTDNWPYFNSIEYGAHPLMEIPVEFV